MYPRCPLKGSFKGAINIGMDMNIDMDAGIGMFTMGGAGDVLEYEGCTMDDMKWECCVGLHVWGLWLPFLELKKYTSLELQIVERRSKLHIHIYVRVYI